MLDKMSNRATKKKDITFELLQNADKDGNIVPEFVPETEEAEKFLCELGLYGDEAEEDSSQDFKGEIQKCTFDDLKDIFWAHAQPTSTIENENVEDEINNSEVNIKNELDKETNLVNELKALGLDFDGNIDIEEIEEMEDDFVVKGFMDEDDDFACYIKSTQNHLINKEVLYKYEDLSSEGDARADPQPSFDEYSTGSGFSASSVARSEGLTNLDNHFESVLREYVNREDDFEFTAQIEALVDAKSCHRAIPVDNAHFQSVCREFMYKCKSNQKQTVDMNDPDLKLINRQIIHNYQLEQQHSTDEDDHDDEDDHEDEDDHDDEMKRLCGNPNRYSKKTFPTIEDDLDNDRSSSVSYQPQIIRIKPTKKIVIPRGSGIPKEVDITPTDNSNFKNNSNNEGYDSELESYISDLKSNYTSMNSVAGGRRDKNESKEDKKNRKTIVKQYKQLRRCEKKMNNMAFKKESEKIHHDQTKINSTSFGKSLL